MDKKIQMQRQQAMGYLSTINFKSILFIYAETLTKVSLIFVSQSLSKFLVLFTGFQKVCVQVKINF